MVRWLRLHRRLHGVGLIAFAGATAILTAGSSRVVVTAGAGATQRAQVAGIRIVVLEGEGAVNIIQQKTAVAPVVEVRDRNDQPVAGAVVRFAIRGGRASFNGARTLTVTSNAAGRAAVSGVTPTSSGAFQISASASFQGQTAAATIAQTNVLTGAQAAAVAGGGGSGAGGAAAGAGAAVAAGGGLSATTLGIVGGAVAGGALVAKKELAGGNDSGGDAGNGSTQPSDFVKATAGTYQLQLVRGSPLPVQLFGQCSIGGQPPCAPCTESATSGTLTLGSSPPKYAINLIAGGPCVDPLGGGSTTTNSYITGAEGNWADAGGGTISFTSNALGLSAAAISGSSIATSFNWLHPSSGGTPVTAVFGR